MEQSSDKGDRYVILGDAPIEARSLRSIIDAVRECIIFVHHEDFRVLATNRAFHTTFGANAKDAEGRYLHDLGEGEWNIPTLLERLRHLGEDGSVQDFRVEHDIGISNKRVFMLNAHRIESTPWILIAIEDATMRVRAEQALAASESAFRNMLATAAEAIVMTNAAGEIVFANHMMKRVFGFEEVSELIGLSIDMLVPERLRGDHARRRAEYVAAPSPRPMGQRDRNLVGRRKDGTEFPIEVVLGSMTREDGPPVIVAFITDITRRREAERRIGEYQDKLQRMAFDAAVAEERQRRRIAVDLHDLIGQSLAVAQIRLTSVREMPHGAVRVAIEEVLALLAQCIAEQRTLLFELSPPVLYDLGIKEALSWLCEDLERRHGLQVKLADDDARKPLDETTAAIVFRAVRELLMNVFKHAKTLVAHVLLRRTEDDLLDVVVEDNGVGFVLDAANFSGFGLFSVREQISRLGGVLEIVSAPTQGTRVHMQVPLRSASALAPAAGKPAQPREKTGKNP